METSYLAEDIRRGHRMKFRYDTSGRWFKGNLHLHTNRSDGHLTPNKLVDMYAGEKFDFIAITDHWCLPEYNGNLQSFLTL